MLIRSLSFCSAYCFRARFGGIKELLSPTLLFFTFWPSDSSSSVSWWELWPLEPLAPGLTSDDPDAGGWLSVGITGVWKPLSWANLHFVSNLHLPFLRKASHTRLPPMWERLASIVKGTCFCRALSFWSAWALKGLANTLLSMLVCRGGGGSLFDEGKTREGAGRVDRDATEGACSGVWVL